MFGDSVQLEDMEQVTRQIWSSFGFGRVTQKMVAQTEPVLSRVASVMAVEPAPDEKVPTARRGAEFSVSGRMEIRSLRDNFKEQFGSILRVYDRRRIASDDEIFGSIAKQTITIGSTISAHGRTKVGILKTT